MGSVVKSLEKAVNSMELQKISEVMDMFESQFEDLDVHTAVSIFKILLKHRIMAKNESEYSIFMETFLPQNILY